MPLRSVSRLHRLAAGTVALLVLLLSLLALRAGVSAFLLGALAAVATLALTWLLRKTRLALAALERSETQFRTICEASPLGVFTTDPTGGCLYLNPRFLELFGRPLETSLGHGWVEGIHPEDRAQVWEKWSAAMQSRTVYRNQTRWLRPDGRVVWVRANANPILKQGEVTGWVGTVEDLTPQWETTQENRRLALVAEQTGNAVLLADAEAVVTWVNPAFCRLCGYGSAELLGRPAGGFLQGPQTDPRAAQALADALRVGRGFSGELLHVRKDGQPYWAALTLTPVRRDDASLEGFIAIASDATERKQTEQALLQAEQRFRAATYLSTDGFCILKAVASPEGRVEDWIYEEVNARGAALLNRRREALLGRRVTEFFPREGLRPFLENYERVLKKRIPLEEEIEISLPGVNAAWVQQQVVPLEGAVALTVRDISERKLREAQVETARRAAEQAAGAKGEFLAVMSHEIRTPMNGVIGFTSVLLDTPLSAEQRGYVEIIRQSGESLLALIDDILDYSKVESGRIELERGNSSRASAWKASSPSSSRRSRRKPSGCG